MFVKIITKNIINHYYLISNMRLKNCVLAWLTFKIDLTKGWDLCYSPTETTRANCCSGTYCGYDSCCSGTYSCTYDASHSNYCSKWSSVDCSSSGREIDVQGTYTSSFVDTQQSGTPYMTLTTRWNDNFFTGAGGSMSGYSTYYCPIQSCSIYRIRDRTGSTCDQTTRLFGVKSGGSTTVSGDYDWYRDLCQYEHYCIICNNFGASQTQYFDVNIECPSFPGTSTLAVIQKPTTGYITNNWQAFPIRYPATQPTYYIKRYTAYVGGDTGCPAVQEYDVFDTDGTTRSTTFGDDAYQGSTSSLPTGPDGTNVLVQLSNSAMYQVEADYTFRVNIYSYPDATAIHNIGQEDFDLSAANSTVTTDYDGNPIVYGSNFKWLNLELHVYCDSLSTYLTQNALPSHGVTIYRPINNGAQTIYATGAYDTTFTMSTFNTYVAACYVEALEISDTYVDDTTFNQHPYMTGTTNIVTAPNVRTFSADPTDISAHRDYIFYARMTALGQYKKVFPQQYTMYVGCTSSMTLTDSTSFLTGPFALNVGDSRYNVYTFYDPTNVNRPWCTSVLNIPIDVYVSTNNGVSWVYSQTAVTVAASCNGYSPCNSFDLARIDYEYIVKFKIRTYVSQAPESNPTSGIQHESPEVQFTITCGPSSTGINTKLTNADSRTYFRWITNTNTDVYNFFEDDFWCDYPICCTTPYPLTYTMSSTSPALTTHVDMNPNPTNIDTALSNPNYTISIPVGTHAANTNFKAIDFYIYVSNGATLGNFVLSAKISTQELFNCYYDNFYINSAVSFLKLNFTVYENTTYSDDFSTRFTHDGPESVCPISNYEFKMVQDNETTRFWSLAEINRNYKLDATSGLFEIRIFNTVYYFNKIYVRIYNSFIWSDVTITGHVAEVQFYPQEQVLPNFDPILEGDVINYQVIEGDSTDVQLPVIEDFNSNDTVSIELSFNGQPATWITFNNDTQQIEVDIDQVKEECPECFGLNTLEVSLTDGQGGETTYTIQLEIREPADEKIELAALEKDIYDYESNLTAKITKMNQIGEMTVTFSHEMDTEWVNVSMINQTHLDIYVKPENNRHMQRGFNFSTLNLTWNVTNFNNSDLDIQLNFFEAPTISPLLVQDKIVFHIRKAGIPFFVSKPVFEQSNNPAVLRNLGAALVEPMFIDKDYRTLDRRLVKQMWNTNLSRQALKSFRNTNHFLLYATMFFFALTFVFSGAMTYQFQLLRALQLCLHLPMLSVVFPANALSFVSEMMQCITYDILETFTELIFMFSKDSEEKYVKTIPHQVQDIGYESHFSLQNMGSLGLFMTMYFCQIGMFILLVIFITVFCRCRNEDKYKVRVFKLQKYLRYQLFWGELIIMLLEAYFEFLIAGWLQLKNQNSVWSEEIVHSGDEYSVIMGWLNVSFALVLLPGMFIYILCQNIERINDESFIRVYGAAYDDMKTKNKMQVAFFLFYCIRRIIYVLTAMMLYNHMYWQIMILHSMNLATGMYNAEYRILKRNYAHGLENFNELMVTAITLHCLLFSEWVTDDHAIYAYGWSMDIFIIILIIANQTIIFFHIYYILRLLCIKYFRRIRPWLEKIYYYYILPYIRPCLDAISIRWQKLRNYLYDLYERLRHLLICKKKEKVVVEEVKEVVEEKVEKKKKKKKVMVEVTKTEEMKPVEGFDWIDNPDKWDVSLQNQQPKESKKVELVEMEVTESEEDEYEFELKEDPWDFIKHGGKDFQGFRHDRIVSFGGLENLDAVGTTDWEAIMRQYEGTRYDYDHFDREDFIRLYPGVDFDEFMAKMKQSDKSKKLEEAQSQISQEDQIEEQKENTDQWAGIIAKNVQPQAENPDFQGFDFDVPVKPLDWDLKLKSKHKVKDCSQNKMVEKLDVFDIGIDKKKEQVKKGVYTYIQSMFSSPKKEKPAQLDKTPKLKEEKQIDNAFTPFDFDEYKKPKIEVQEDNLKLQSSEIKFVPAQIPKENFQILDPDVTTGRIQESVRRNHEPHNKMDSISKLEGMGNINWQNIWPTRINDKNDIKLNDTFCQQQSPDFGNKKAYFVDNALKTYQEGEMNLKRVNHELWGTWSDIRDKNFYSGKPFVFNSDFTWSVQGHVERGELIYDGKTVIGFRDGGINYYYRLIDKNKIEINRESDGRKWILFRYMTEYKKFELDHQRISYELPKTKPFEFSKKKIDTPSFKIKLNDVAKVEIGQKSSLEEVYARNPDIQRQQRLGGLQSDTLDSQIKFSKPDALKPVDFNFATPKGEIVFNKREREQITYNLESMYQGKSSVIEKDLPNLTKGTSQISISDFALKRNTEWDHQTEKGVIEFKKSEQEKRYQIKFEGKNKLSLQGVREHLEIQPHQLKPLEKRTALKPFDFDLEGFQLNDERYKRQNIVPKREELKFELKQKQMISKEKTPDFETILPRPSQVSRYEDDSYTPSGIIKINQFEPEQTPQLLYQIKADSQRKSPQRGQTKWVRKVKKKKKPLKQQEDHILQIIEPAVEKQETQTDHVEFDLLKYTPEISVMKDIDEYVKIGRDAEKRNAKQPN